MASQRAVQTGASRIIVVANEKGGSGKSTIAIHIAVALIKAGQYSSHHRSGLQAEESDPLRREPAGMGQSRRRRPRNSDACLHRRADGLACSDEEETLAHNALVEVIEDLAANHSYVIIDTPGHQSQLTSLVHTMADTLVTPLNDSFVDFDVLGTVDAEDAAAQWPQPLCRDRGERAPRAQPSQPGADRMDRVA